MPVEPAETAPPTAAPSRTVTDRPDPWAADALVATLGLERAPFAPGDALPPFWHWLYFREAAPAHALGIDGHPRPALDLPRGVRRMWAGGRLRVAAPLPLGQAATKRTGTAAVTEKQGRSGPLVLVTLRHEVFAGAAAEGTPLLVEEQDLVYRIPPRRDAPLPAPEEAPADETHARSWSCDPTCLFRYSALTFNGHRIHYDADYARGVEGYPGLVVHGPLLATLLLELAGGIIGVPRRFSFRARAPVFVDEPFETCARASLGEGDLALWVRGADGRLAMTAEAGV